MRFAKVLTIVLLINSTMNPSSNANALNEIRWHKRVVIVFASKLDKSALVFKEHLDSSRCSLRERDVDVYLIDDAKALALSDGAAPLDRDSIELLHASRRDKSESFEMILIGKDGGIKAGSYKPEDLLLFIDLIDGMPMRRAEAANQVSEC
ncbi:MAG: DUF4174 domain-containing protein [Granulosicoccus sp.]